MYWKIKEFFNVDRWQINQPIVIAELASSNIFSRWSRSYCSTKDDNPQKHPVLITNKWQTSDGYSGNVYDINYATKDGIVYPSLDPSMFELKYPDADVEGRAVVILRVWFFKGEM